MPEETEAYENWLARYGEPAGDEEEAEEAFPPGIAEDLETNVLLFFCQQAGISYVRLTSYSKGRRRNSARRRPRREPVMTEFLRVGGKLMRIFPGDCTDCRVPLDKIAQEILPTAIYDTLGPNPGERLLLALREESDRR